HLYPEPNTTMPVVRADLDADGADEFIGVVRDRQSLDRTFDRHGELLIFKGGPSFQLDRPTVVLRDTGTNDDSFTAYVKRFDGDAYPDIVVVPRNYSGRDR